MNRPHPSVFLLSAAALLSARSVAAQAPASNGADAPTAGILTPQQIDAQWIAASRKYDGERERLLGSATPLTFHQQPDGLHITVPAKPVRQYAYAYRITWRSKLWR